MSRVANATALIERISGTPEHPLDRLTSSRRRPPSTTGTRVGQRGQKAPEGGSRDAWICPKGSGGTNRTPHARPVGVSSTRLAVPAPSLLDDTARWSPCASTYEIDLLHGSVPYWPREPAGPRAARPDPGGA